MAVISPGSRSAPLALAFARQKEIECFVVPDERSAAYMALGMAQSTGNTVALVCTSGTAALNYAPAIAEAFYSYVPLLAFTADRPPEWVDQGDGQTVRQEGLYGKHVKGSWSLPVDTSHPDGQWHFFRILNEAANQTLSLPHGPVHVNVPLREPLYEQERGGSVEMKVIDRISTLHGISNENQKQLTKLVDKKKKVLIVPGQGIYSIKLQEQLASLVKDEKAVVVADIISNISPSVGAIRHHDLFLGAVTDGQVESLAPDLLITFGRPIISKQLKLFLRQCSPDVHMHIQPYGGTWDLFQSLTQLVCCDPETFFEGVTLPEMDPDFMEKWQKYDNLVVNELKEHFKEEKFGELLAVKKIMELTAKNTVLHFGNSMPVRYGNMINEHGAEAVYCNRGASGIDGVNSTAVGHALADPGDHMLIIGDVSFLYDRNAFWHNHLPDNLKIVILNNHGGGIFRMIDGPAKQPELERFFETVHDRDARLVAEEFGFEYFSADNTEGLHQNIQKFANCRGRCIFEVFSNKADNTAILKEIKEKIVKEVKR